MPKVPRTLHCKKAVVSNPNGTLQDMVINALARNSQASQRQEIIGTANPPRYRLIGQHYPHRKTVSGVLMVYEPGSKAASMVNDPRATQIAIHHFSAPPDPSGQTREWLDGMLFFMIMDDFLVCIQSASVRSDQIEEHLSWLLTTNPANPVFVTLKDKPPSHVQKMIDKHHVKSITINGALLEPSTVDANGAKVISPNYEAPMLDSIKGVLPSNHGFNWLDGMDGNLEAKLELTFKRKTTASAQELLDKLAVTLRNANGIDAELLLGSGDRISQDKLRLETKRPILAKDGVLDVQSAFDEMYNWLEQLAKSGQL